VFDGDFAVNVYKYTRMCFELLTGCDSDLAIVYRSPTFSKL